MGDRMRVGIDVDGVLADFNTSYRNLIHQLCEIRLPEISPTYPNSWHWVKDVGVPNSVENAAWDRIKDTKEQFWANLKDIDPNVGTFLNWASWLPFNVELYFITSRVGSSAKNQTERWIMEHGWGHNLPAPTVLISSEKGMCARALKLTHYIDDKTENCADVISYSPNTVVFMPKRPWNGNVEGVSTITELKEFREVIDGVLNG